VGKALLAAALFGAAAVAGCATTEMTSTWTDPSAKGARLSKVAVVALAQDEGLRRMAEDEVARNIQGAQVLPSYQALEGVDLGDKEAVRQKLRQQGFEGVLVMRVAGVDEQVTTVPFDTYYMGAYGAEFGTGVEVDRIVRVVSNLYSLDEGKLIWSGASKTFDPSSAKDMVDDVSREVAKKLEEEGIIA
jgi:hypothetical protein